MYINDTTGIGVSLDEFSHRLYEGQKFILADQNNLSSGTHKIFYLGTSSSATCLSINLKAANVATLDIYESPTLSVSGGSNSANFLFNANRQRSTSPVLTVSANPVIYSASGTRLSSQISGSGTDLYTEIYCLAYNCKYLVDIGSLGTGQVGYTFNIIERKC